MTGSPGQDAPDPAPAAWRFLVPNSITALSGCLGIASILLVIEGRFDWAAWCVLWCVLLDKLDGTAARLLGSTSKFGSQFDSLADLISFGLAPGVLVYGFCRASWPAAVLGPLGWTLAVGSVFFALMAAVRLARFNTFDLGHKTRIFRGIPTTLCGAIVPALVLVAIDHQLGPAWTRFLPAGLCLLGLGMISRLPVPKVVPRRSRALNLFQWANLAFVYVCGILLILPEYILGLAGVYLLVGSSWGLLRRPQQDPRAARESAPTDP